MVILRSVRPSRGQGVGPWGHTLGKGRYRFWGTFMALWLLCCMSSISHTESCHNATHHAVKQSGALARASSGLSELSTPKAVRQADVFFLSVSLPREFLYINKKQVDIGVFPGGQRLIAKMCRMKPKSGLSQSKQQ